MAPPVPILIVDYTKWAFDQGLGYVDLLRGDEPFKYRFANAETRLNDYSGAQTLYGRLMLGQHGWYSRMRASLSHWHPSNSSGIDAEQGDVLPLAHQR